MADIKPQTGTVGNDYDPLAQPVNDKSYSTPPMQVNPADLQGDIPEPSFIPPPIAKAADPFEDDFKQQQAEELKKQKEQEKIPFNPQLSDLSPSRKEEAAAQTADLILHGYDKIHMFANQWLKISERKVYKLQRKGELDLSAPVPYDLDKTVTAGEFIRMYNDQVEGTLLVDPEFKKEVKPILTRVLAKRGHGLSDEHHLLLMFGQDLVWKANMFYQMKSTTRMILDLAREQTEAMRSQSVPPPAPPQAQAPAPVVPIHQHPSYAPVPGSPLSVQAEFTGSNMPVNVVHEGPSNMAVKQTDITPPIYNSPPLSSSTDYGSTESELTQAKPVSVHPDKITPEPDLTTKRKRGRPKKGAIADLFAGQETTEKQPKRRYKKREK